MNILHFLSDLFYDVVSCFAAMEFGQAACCLASLNPLWTVIYAGTSCRAAIIRYRASDVEESSGPRVSVGVSHR